MRKKAGLSWYILKILTIHYLALYQLIKTDLIINLHFIIT